MLKAQFLAHSSRFSDTLDFFKNRRGIGHDLAPFFFFWFMNLADLLLREKQAPAHPVTNGKTYFK